MAKTNNDFQAELERLFTTAQKCGFVAVEVCAGALHRRVGDYPGADHRMPVRCGVMRKSMNDSDSVVDEPEKGIGATLIIRYSLPR